MKHYHPNLLKGVSYGLKQNSAVPNLTGQSGNLVFNNSYSSSVNKAITSNTTGGAGIRATRSAKYVGTISLNASNCSSVYQNNVNEARPINRNYLPIIKLG